MARRASSRGLGPSSVVGVLEIVRVDLREKFGSSSPFLGFGGLGI